MVRVFAVRPTAGAPLPLPVRGAPDPATGEPSELRALALTEVAAAALPEAPGRAVCGDAGGLLVGLRDGGLVSVSWDGEVGGVLDPLDDAFGDEESGEGGEARWQQHREQQQQQQHYWQQQQQQQQQHEGGRAIVHLEWAPVAGALVAVLADGSAALCRAAGGGTQPQLAALEFCHWLCGPEAR
jgi:hypothetical protein